ncbi:hypothetical protein NEOLEDRAFT_1127728 [Neolentinus lepideus HHB14362 ss-1]|uniref:Uncharacterized protein n=1 Tax=Neolentinus lepideus HHB14362 ss-1 TaxID=1314782 RepID=A0A165VLH2_9AGAM|nr:hypothetical protein NEOLEDRAFT_1130384 [Neolentinus lepideus HHB14362 ss-1]KZT29849.1 hypothetical protein NEOLEDRAFT_1127728 [Neolentinus lepideus HHB14362 ss-1]
MQHVSIASRAHIKSITVEVEPETTGPVVFSVSFSHQPTPPSPDPTPASPRTPTTSEVIVRMEELLTPSGTGSANDTRDPLESQWSSPTFPGHTSNESVNQDSSETEEDSQAPSLTSSYAVPRVTHENLLKGATLTRVPIPFSSPVSNQLELNLRGPRHLSGPSGSRERKRLRDGP